MVSQDLPFARQYGTHASHSPEFPTYIWQVIGRQGMLANAMRRAALDVDLHSQDTRSKAVLLRHDSLDVTQASHARVPATVHPPACRATPPPAFRHLRRRRRSARGHWG